MDNSGWVGGAPPIVLMETTVLSAIWGILKGVLNKSECKFIFYLNDIIKLFWHSLSRFI